MNAADCAETLKNAAALRSQGDLEGAYALYEQCLQFPQMDQEPELVAQAYLKQTDIRYTQGRLDDAQWRAERARSIAAEAGASRLEGRAANFLGIIAMQRQDWDAADTLFREALERAYQARDDELVGAVCMNLGAISNIKGELREARSFYLESIGSGVRTADRRPLVMAYNNLGMVCSDLEEWMEAIVYFARGIEIAGGHPDPQLIATLLVNQAEPQIETGDLERALESLDAAEGHARAGLNTSVLADCARFRGRIARLRGQSAEAMRYLDEALELARDDRLTLSRAEALEERGYLLRDRGDATAADKELEHARTLYASIGAVRDAARVAAQVASSPAAAAGESPIPERP